MKIAIRLVTIFVALVMLSACAKAAAVTITDGWARTGLAGGTSAAYFIIHNSTQQADALIGVSCPAAGRAELHRSEMDASGTMTMRPQESIAVGAGEEEIFEPGGYHVMLMDLTEDLQPGDTIDLLLQFEKAGDVPITIQVKEP